MNRFKRASSLVMVLIFSLLLAACGAKQTPAPAAPSAQSGNTAPAKPAEPAKPAWPTKAVTIVSHTAAGGGMDVFLRELAPLLQKELGQPIVIENRSGGSSAVAVQYVTGQPADGYTLIGMTDTLVLTPIKNTTPKGLKDMQGIVNIVTDPVLLFVKKDSPIKDIKEVIEKAKAGTKILLASPQVGSPESAAVETLINKHGLKGLTPVPVESGAEGLKAILGGQVQVSIAEPSEVVAQIKAGEIRVIATITSKRMPQMPDVPTMDELGYPVAVDKFRGIAAPKGVPAEVTAVLEKAVKKVMDSPEYKVIYDRNFQIPSFLGSADFEKFLQAKDAKYREYLKK